MNPYIDHLVAPSAFTFNKTENLHGQIFINNIDLLRTGNRADGGSYLGLKKFRWETLPLWVTEVSAPDTTSWHQEIRTNQIPATAQALEVGRIMQKAFENGSTLVSWYPLLDGTPGKDKTLGDFEASGLVRNGDAAHLGAKRLDFAAFVNPISMYQDEASGQYRIFAYYHGNAGPGDLSYKPTVKVTTDCNFKRKDKGGRVVPVRGHAWQTIDSIGGKTQTINGGLPSSPARVTKATISGRRADTLLE